MARRECERCSGGLKFDRWRSELVETLTAMMLKGKAIDRRRRELAGFPKNFLDSLAAFEA